MAIRNRIPLIKVAVGCLVNNNQEILIARRGKNKLLPDLWEFPGGKLEQNESYKDALYRELKEEINISIKVDLIESLLVKTISYGDFDCKVEFFLCNEWEGEILALEQQQLIWQKIDDLERVAMLQGNDEVIYLLQQRVF